jgi:toxin ParE1/3/4
MKQVRLSPQAELDLEEIEDYISRDNPAAARQLILTVLEKFELLSSQPGIGRNRADVSPDLRSFPINNYVIFYRMIRGDIEVVRVVHGARDVHQLFGAD